MTAILATILMFVEPACVETQQAQSPVSVSIAKVEGMRILRRNGLCHVVITNTSDERLNLWKEWCSWGYYNIRFELLDESGAIKTVIIKKQQIWDKNYPDKFTLEPGEHCIRSVKIFDDGVWQFDEMFSDLDTSIALDNEGRPRSGSKFRIRVVFEIKPTNEATEHKVWVGRVVSPVWQYEVLN